MFNRIEEANKNGNVLPEFVRKITQGVRANAERDTVIRLRVDNSAKSVVAFSAEWLEGPNRIIHRRVCLETKTNEDGHYVLIYSAKVFDESAKVITYTDENMQDMPAAIMGYLRKGQIQLH